MAFYNEFRTKEELYDILTAIYDIEEKTALFLIENLISRGRLSESEEILLASHEIPQEFINYIQENKNIKKLSNIKETLNDDAQVGPFFFINRKLYSHSVKMRDFKNESRFYNDPISHFEFFKTLGIYGDYGNYPRGRVLYDSLKDKYIVYMDKSIMTDEVKKSVIISYCLEERKTVFRRDVHYTHDGL